MSHLFCYQLVYLVIWMLTCLLTVQTQDNIFTITPNQSLCIGEPVVITCYLFPPVGVTYVFFARLSFNQSASLEFTTINSNFGSIGYTATVGIPIMGVNARIQLTIGSFQVSDSNTLFGCHARFNSNGSDTEALESGSASLAAAPSAPIVVVSLSSLSPTNCTNALLSWTADSDRAIERYYVYRDSTLLAVSTDTQYTDTDQLMVNTPYSYSVIANSCAGNSTGGVYISTITGSELSDSPPFFINYTSSDSMLFVDWTLKPNPGAPPVLLLYSLILEYSHSRESTNYTFSNTTQFSLLSSDVTTLSVVITAHNFTSEDGVQTEVTAYISIAQQCGTPFSGVEQRADYNSSNLPTRPPPTTAPTTTPNGTTPGMSTTTTAIAPTSGELPIAIIAAAVGGGGVVLFILIIILVVIMLCICCGKKSEGSKYPNHRRSEDNVELSAPGHSTDNIPSEAMYSQVNRPQKSPNTAGLYSSVQKQAPPQKELLYADLDIMSSQTGRVHTSVVPLTQYTDLAQLPAADHTLYASVHTDGPS